MSIIGVVCDDKATAFRILLLVGDLVFRRRLHRQHSLLIGLQCGRYVTEVKRLLGLVRLPLRKVACFLVLASSGDTTASRRVEARCSWQTASVMLVVVVLLLLLVEEVVSEAHSSSRVGIPFERAPLRSRVGSSRSCWRQDDHRIS